jgi:hypothetical protein
MAPVAELKSWNKIFRPLPMVKELVNPVKEEENKDSLDGLTNDDEIVAQVHLEQALECGEVEEVELDDDERDTNNVKATKMLEIFASPRATTPKCGGGQPLQWSQNLARRTTPSQNATD